MNFPIINTPINSTTAFVLQKTKPTQNDLDRYLEDLRMFQTTYKRILSGKNTPERKQQLRGLGLKIQSIQTKIHNCRKLLNQTKRYDVGMCFMEICHQKMEREDFIKIYNQAQELSLAIKRQIEKENKGDNK